MADASVGITFSEGRPEATPSRDLARQMVHDRNPRARMQVTLLSKLTYSSRSAPEATPPHAAPEK